MHHDSALVRAIHELGIEHVTKEIEMAHRANLCWDEIWRMEEAVDDVLCFAGLDICERPDPEAMKEALEKLCETREALLNALGRFGL